MCSHIQLGKKRKITGIGTGSHQPCGVVTYVEKAELGADVEDAAGGGRPAEQRQERLGEHPGPVEVGPEHCLRVLHRVGVDLVERHRRVVHLRGSEAQQQQTADQVQNHTGLPGFRISDAGRAWPHWMAYLGRIT